jgi:arylsulfatase A-like enzyme
MSQIKVICARGETVLLNRREFLSTGVAAVAAAQLPANAEAPKQKKQPNVLYVFDDQHRAVSLPGEPFAAVAAPNIDKFRRDNMSLDTCISNFPLCCPYRAVLASGKYSAVNGVMGNSQSLQTSELSIHKAFKHNGYRVGYVGKWHLDAGVCEKDTCGWTPPGPRRFEIDDWHIWDNTNSHYACYTFDEKGNRVVAKHWAPIDMTDQAIGLLGEYKKLPEDQPWFLTLSYNPPHPPFDPPDAERNQNPENMQKYRPNVQVPGDAPWLQSTDKFHHAMQGYIGGITGIDEQFGRLMKALDDSGMAGDTIVVFTSDHGEMLGSQGRHGKVVPWDESNHVPFMVRYPGVTPKGGSTKQLFAAIDIYPSLCGMAGIPVPEHCQGHNLSDMWRGRKVANAPDHVFIQNGGSTEKAGHAESGGKKHKRAQAANGSPASGAGSESEEDGGAHPYRGVRTEQWTYTVAPNGRWLLYDNVADPYQMKNLAQDSTHKELMDGFDVKIKAWLLMTSDPFHFPAIA